MAGRELEKRGTGLTRLVYVREDGALIINRNGKIEEYVDEQNTSEINFNEECVGEQNIQKIHGPFTIPANAADVSARPDFLRTFISEGRPNKK